MCIFHTVLKIKPIVVVTFLRFSCLGEFVGRERVHVIYRGRVHNTQGLKVEQASNDCQT